MKRQWSDKTEINEYVGFRLTKKEQTNAFAPSQEIRSLDPFLQFSLQPDQRNRF